ncbi:MAG: sugar ABC transporter substrate-binding protein [bacterium]
MQHKENNKFILSKTSEAVAGHKKNNLLMHPFLLSVLFLITAVTSLYFYNLNGGGVNKIIKENVNLAVNDTKDYKKIAYVGFSKEGQPFWTAMAKYLEASALTRKIFYTDLTPSIASAELQIASLDLAIEQKVDGIIIGAAFPSQLVNVLAGAYEKNIPVVAIDTQVDSPAIVSLIATNNLESARLAGDYIVNATNGKGTLLILCGEKTHPNSIAREKGVREMVEKAGMKVVVQYTDWQIEKAYQLAKEELIKPNNGIKAIFSCFDPGIISVQKVIENMNLQGKIITVGFDGLQETYKMIQDNKISATVAQPIKQMAREGIEKIIEHLNNIQVVKEDLIPGIIVTKTNVGYFLD